MIKLPYNYITGTTTWRDHDPRGYIGPTKTMIRCEYCVADGTGQNLSQVIPQAGEEIDIAGAHYYVSNIDMGMQANYWRVILDCVALPMKPAEPDFVYDPKQLLETLKEMFRKKRYE